jgi:hypothetical protein
MYSRYVKTGFCGSSQRNY